MRKRFMMYVATDADRSGRFCAGSRECIALIQANPPLLQKTRFENVDVIRHEGPLPTWLYGTPTLVDIDLKRIMRGTSARDYLLGIAVDVVVHTDVEIATTSGKAVGHRHLDGSDGSTTRHNTQIRDEPISVEVTQTKRVTEDDLTRHLQERELLTAQLMRAHE